MRRLMGESIHSDGEAPMADPGPGRPRLRDSVRRQLRRRLLVGSAVAVVLGALSGGGWWLAQSGLVGEAAAQAREGAVMASAQAGLAVDDILVSGRDHTAAPALLDALRLERGAPILAFDPAAARARVEALPWVAAASVERRLPDTVFVHIRERMPLAVWQRDGRFTLIDAQGAEIPGVDVGPFAALPLVVGADAPQHAADLLAMLDTQPALAARVRAAVRIGARRWNVVLDNGIDIALPETEPEVAWARLAAAQAARDLLSRDLAEIDLRLPDRLVIRARQRNGPEDSPPAETRGA